MWIEYFYTSKNIIIRIYSYNTLIAEGRRNIENKNDCKCYFNRCYYSNTTRKHQGLAYNILNCFATFFTEDIYLYGIKKAKTQKQLKDFYGYAKLDQQRGTDKITISNNI